MPGIATRSPTRWIAAGTMRRCFSARRRCTGHVLVAVLKSPELRRSLTQLSKQFGQLDGDRVASDARTMWAQSDGESGRCSTVRADRAGAPTADGAEGAAGNTALDRYSTDMTAIASSGKLDPIVGRDDEIRQIIDVLLRRRQEQPDPDRRGWRRQDRCGRALRPAAGRRWRAAATERPRVSR